MNDQDFERREKARQDAIFDPQFADEPTSDVEYADEPPCKTGSQCTNKCQRCGEINPAEIHTCSPEPQVNGWPLYSGLPQPKPEPVAWMYNGNLHEFDPSDWAEGEVTPLYTAPPQRECVSCAGLCCQDYEKCNLPCTPRGREQARREWQTLTENEIKHLWYEACQTNLELTSQLIVHLARNIEDKLKEKNT